MDMKCIADTFSKQMGQVCGFGSLCLFFFLPGSKNFPITLLSVNHDFLMGMGRRHIGLKSTPQSFSPLLSRNSENGFLLWGKNTLFQFPLVFLPWDSLFPSILTSWDLDKCVEKIIHSNHIGTSGSRAQRCLESAERKRPSRTVFWPLAVWWHEPPWGAFSGSGTSWRERISQSSGQHHL